MPLQAIRALKEKVVTIVTGLVWYGEADACDMHRSLCGVISIGPSCGG